MISLYKGEEWGQTGPGNVFGKTKQKHFLYKVMHCGWNFQRLLRELGTHFTLKVNERWVPNFISHLWKYQSVWWSLVQVWDLDVLFSTDSKKQTWMLRSVIQGVFVLVNKGFMLSTLANLAFISGPTCEWLFWNLPLIVGAGPLKSSYTLFFSNFISNPNLFRWGKNSSSILNGSHLKFKNPNFFQVNQPLEKFPNKF